MSEPIKTRFSTLYKSVGILKGIEFEKQKVRRQQLLEEQKSLRAVQHDDFRHLDEFIAKLSKKKPHRNLSGKKYIDENPVQLSEWMRGKPEDINQWFLVPCPKGQRCLIVATNGKTELYNKRGCFIRSFHTDLPGDQRAKHQVTILDCILDKKTKRIFILDMIAYSSQDIANCDTQFRFYWVINKLLECKTHSDSEYQLVALSHYDLADESAVASCLERFPQFENNSPELDGFLFYHKDASYTHGETPLVLWLFAFMIPEVLGYNIHPTYMMNRPSEYIDYLHFIQEFDDSTRTKNSRTKRRNERGKSEMTIDNPEMEHDYFENEERGGIEYDEIQDESFRLEEIIDEERRLEMETR